MSERKTIILNSEKIEWQDGDKLLTLPKGVKIKILSEDKSTGRRDMLVKFSKGYVEPRHTHDGYHSDVLLEGTWIVEGKTLKPGDYVFGPRGEEHGPFECPNGCLVFASFYGKPEHRY